MDICSTHKTKGLRDIGYLAMDIYPTTYIGLPPTFKYVVHEESKQTLETLRMSCDRMTRHAQRRLYSTTLQSK